MLNKDIYLKYRSKFFYARTAFHIAKQLENFSIPDELAMLDKEHYCKITRSGLDIEYRKTNDSNDMGIDYVNNCIGFFTDQWYKGAIHHGYNNPNNLDWFIPRCEFDELYEELHRQGYSKHESHIKATSAIRDLYHKALTYGETWWLVSIEIRVLKNDIELASGEVYELLNSETVTSYYEQLMEKTDEAIEEATRNLKSCVVANLHQSRY